MRNFKLVISFVLLLTLLVPAGSFIAAQDDDTITFTVWVPNDHPIIIDVFGPLAEEYEAETGVSIEYVFIPFAEYESSVATRLSGNNPPDAGWLVERNGPAFLDAGVLYDLGETLRGDEAYNYADFSASASAQWVVDEAVYGVPFSTSPFITIYNADLFEAAGLSTPAELAEEGEWTWDALREAAATIAEETESWGFVGNDGASAMYSTNPWQTLIPLLRAYGADVLKDNECVMNSEEAVSALGLMHDMVYEDRSTVPPGDETVFWTGDVGMTLGQISRLSNLDEAEFEWGIAPLPTGPAGSNPVIGQAAIVAFDANNNGNQAQAADFVRFLTTETGVTLMTQFFPPARLSVLSSDEFLTTNPRVNADDMENVVAAQIANGRVLTSHPNFPEIELTGGVILDELWQPDAEVAPTMDLYCQTISQFLND